jgi:hypothetical protein
MIADFTLVNQRLLVGVYELNRVFYSNDVRALIRIDLINQCGKGR